MKKVLKFLVMLFLFIPLVACSTTERNVEIVRTQWDSSDVQGQFYIIDSADELNEYGPEIKGITGAVEVANPQIHEKVCPSKSL